MKRKRPYESIIRIGFSNKSGGTTEESFLFSSPWNPIANSLKTTAWIEKQLGHNNFSVGNIIITRKGYR